MNLRDTLYNWLQIKLVADARPEDRAAADTRDFFELMLTEDHHALPFGISSADEENIHVFYTEAGNRKFRVYDRVDAYRLLQDINDNPKYNEQ
ncbi:hypothetical protein SY83_14905 [Paenibacillus swuensis]|uniref:Uncharacterized protein n=1 Tax=Paenibacillus swuensis TaxID=1178515 RepID=A0A172TKP8_9BACL|nr:hypothetical protein [Paenibacillus swuensis]ANE47343.1 hypothetical protein SY83_14905 [Paenibacillus swuensis]